MSINYWYYRVPSRELWLGPFATKQSAINHANQCFADEVGYTVSGIRSNIELALFNNSEQRQKLCA